MARFFLRGAAVVWLCFSFAIHALPAHAEDASAETINAAVAKALADLPGKTAFAFTEIRDGAPVLRFGENAERLAVGSTFKLFILGTLIDEVNQGRRRSEDIMLLRPELIGPPYSELAGWPAGSPVTLHTLALKMISISDNTATDHLLYLLGRERVEQQMVAMGHGRPELNRPLISTREMTALRDEKRGLPGRDYAKLDDAGRRRTLAQLSNGVADYEQLEFDTSAYDIAEWYASPLDMAHALAWIQQATTDGKSAHDLRAILAVDPKLPHDKKVWPYVGFKGGSEEQLLAGNWLLQHSDGRWFTMHLFWNNPREKVAPEKLIAAVGALFAQIEQTLK